MSRQIGKARRAVTVLLTLLCLTAAVSSAQAEEALRGVALVIGQSAYRTLPKLDNPKNDARAIGDLLENLGFEVTTALDGDTARMKRSLQRFEEDADGADVALVYYSGHGIEAGGENYLVPIDAATDRPQGLAPVSALLKELQAVSPVVIILLDACRTNPFPPGATIVTESGKPTRIAAVGLAGTRGAVALRDNDTKTIDSQGAVLGFAAEPGTVALDGDPGGNSPYAAALLKHLAAGGFHFGDIMTMVSEEVYLASQARQLPWMNASLRRQLYFGVSPPAVDGDDGKITGERRGLLLTIAALPDVARRQVVATAGEQNVPMDALFAMLRQAGAAAPATPDAFDQLLREQSTRLKAMLAAGKPPEISDPELVRLVALADRAVREGALTTAVDLYARAKTRMDALEPGLSQVEQGTDTLRRQRAVVFAQSAETSLLAFDHAAAAADYSSAYDEIERADSELAWRYKLEQGKAEAGLGFYRADNAALDRAIETLRDAADLAPLRKRPAQWLETQTELGKALATRGDRAADNATLEAAVDTLSDALRSAPEGTSTDTIAGLNAELAYALLLTGMREQGTTSLNASASALEAALAIQTREREPQAWARHKHRLAAVLLERGSREATSATLEQALLAADAALAVRTQAAAPLDWASTENNRAIILSALGERDAEPSRLRQSVAAYREVLGVYTRETHPLLWAETLANLGASQFALASRGDGVAMAAQAAASFTDALTEMTRTRAPLRWAALQDNLGMALRAQGDAAGDRLSVEQAVVAFRLALEERTRARVPQQWAASIRNLANALWSLASIAKDPAPLEQGLAALREADTAVSRAETPRDWAMLRNNQAGMLRDLGIMRGETATLHEAVAQYRLALEVMSEADSPLDWAQTTGNMALALLEVGKRDGDKAILAQAVVAFEASRAKFRAAGITRYDGYFDTSIAEAQLADLQITVNEKIKAAAK